MVDGLSLAYSFLEILYKENIENVYSYEPLKKHFLRFLDYLNYRGIVIASICIDAIMETEKVDLMNERANAGVDILFRCIQTGFDSKCFFNNNRKVKCSFTLYYAAFCDYAYQMFGRILWR